MKKHMQAHRKRKEEEEQTVEGRQKHKRHNHDKGFARRNRTIPPIN